jgi:hypothetical protein
MKHFKSIIRIGILLVLMAHYGCESMDDNYKQYIEEYNYSGKIDSLRVYPGYERVILAWDNPKDQKSKTIRVIYGVDSTVVNYDSMVDSVSIEGLDAGTGYEFIVYTLDAHQNLSVPTYITAFPVSQSFVDGLTPPMVVVQAIGPDQYISIMGTSNVLMKFSGNLEYTVNGPDGFTQTDAVYLPEFIGESQIDIPVSSIIPLPFLPEGEYTFEIKVSIFPIISNLISADEVVLTNTQTITVEPVVINLMNIPGTITDRYNTGGGEGIEKVIDGNPNSKYLTGGSQTWMMWKMDREFIATYYTLVSGNDAPGRDPKDWKIEASNDGENWVTLDQQSGILFSNRFEKKTFLMDNRTAYSHYRMNISAYNQTGLFQLAEWTLYYDSAQ